MARAKPAAPTRDDLERIDAGEPREIAALQHNVAQLHREVAAVTRDYESRRSAKLVASLRGTARTVGRRIRG